MNISLRQLRTPRIDEKIFDTTHRCNSGRESLDCCISFFTNFIRLEKFHVITVAFSRKFVTVASFESSLRQRQKSWSSCFEQRLNGGNGSRMNAVSLEGCNIVT